VSTRVYDPRAETQEIQMALNIDKEVAQMQRMTVNELQEKFAQVFGERPRGRNKQWLVKRIAWRMQANEYGGLSERALQRARELANPADLRLSAPRARSETGGSTNTPVPARFTGDSRLPMVGTLLTRRYKGRTLEVKVASDGFEFEGEKYKSLSAIAKVVTGSHWNGYHFFGMAEREKAS
jgi:hypothetical protein